jgi:hypothetical protein
VRGAERREEGGCGVGCLRGINGRRFFRVLGGLDMGR